VIFILEKIPINSKNRSTKADGHKQKPEDYMDDEDMGEFGFAPQKLKTSSKFHNDPKNQRKPDAGE
jgi:G patch domain-containing protein 1